MQLGGLIRSRGFVPQNCSSVRRIPLSTAAALTRPGASHTTLGTLEAAAIAFVLTWICTFTVRLIAVPSTLYYEQKDRADRIETERLESDIEIVFDEAVANYSIVTANRGTKFLTECQIQLQLAQNGTFLSGVPIDACPCFSLRPGEKKQIPIAEQTKDNGLTFPR